MKFKKIHLSVFVAIIVGICMASEMDDVKKEYKDLVHGKKFSLLKTLVVTRKPIQLGFFP